jgi:transposase
LEAIMEAIVERCCGLDVHQATVVACVLVGPPGRKPGKEVRTFGTMTRDLEALRDWLVREGVTHVGMESTGVYWKPVYAILEGHFELIVGNAHQIKSVPGRKTDVRDAEWIGDLLRHGLIKPSFVPRPELRELWDLVRYRRALVETQATERNRVLKLLESANIKLSSVAADVFGVSGLAMLKALAAGMSSPTRMAALARGVLRRKLEPLAFTGRPLRRASPLSARLAPTAARSHAGRARGTDRGAGPDLPAPVGSTAADPGDRPLDRELDPGRDRG